MRNTHFEKGDMSVDELVGGVKQGYYCGDVRGGQAEANSNFQVAIQECFEIENGEIGRPVKGLAISGVAVSTLKLIDGLGKDFGIESSYCGKSDQFMATSDGGPHMRIKKGGIIFGGDE
jgi:TldD protein